MGAHRDRKHDPKIIIKASYSGQGVWLVIGLIVIGVLLNLLLVSGFHF